MSKSDQLMQQMNPASGWPHPQQRLIQPVQPDDDDDDDEIDDDDPFVDVVE